MTSVNVRKMYGRHRQRVISVDLWGDVETRHEVFSFSNDTSDSFEKNTKPIKTKPIKTKPIKTKPIKRRMKKTGKSGAVKNKENKYDLSGSFSSTGSSGIYSNSKVLQNQTNKTARKTRQTTQVGKKVANPQVKPGCLTRSAHTKTQPATTRLTQNKNQQANCSDSVEKGSLNFSQFDSFELMISASSMPDVQGPATPDIDLRNHVVQTNSPTATFHSTPQNRREEKLVESCRNDKFTDSAINNLANLSHIQCTDSPVLPLVDIMRREIFCKPDNLEQSVGHCTEDLEKLTVSDFGNSSLFERRNLGGILRGAHIERGHHSELSAITESDASSSEAEDLPRDKLKHATKHLPYSSFVTERKNKARKKGHLLRGVGQFEASVYTSEYDASRSLFEQTQPDNNNCYEQTQYELVDSGEASSGEWEEESGDDSLESMDEYPDNVFTKDSNITETSQHGSDDKIKGHTVLPMINESVEDEKDSESDKNSTTGRKSVDSDTKLYADQLSTPCHSRPKQHDKEDSLSCDANPVSPTCLTCSLIQQNTPVSTNKQVPWNTRGRASNHVESTTNHRLDMLNPAVSLQVLLTPVRLRQSGRVVPPENKVLHLCDQTRAISFTECIPPSMLRHCKKIGEGVYGEVFRSQRNHKSVALKVIPIEGDFLVNDEKQKTFEEILPEIIMSKELSALIDTDVNSTPNFVHIKGVSVVQGRYPTTLLKQWDVFHVKKTSENDRPDMFDASQLFLIFEFEDCGCDLESVQLTSLHQAKSILCQVTCALAIAEHALQFEHRDLHWGNVLVRPIDTDRLTYQLNGKNFQIDSHGMKVAIIDFTLSRLNKDGCSIYTDLSNDPTLFEGEGDYQFDMYRLMRQRNRDQWEGFEAHTNVLWIHYIADKLVHSKSYAKTFGKEHKSLARQFRIFLQDATKYDSALRLLNDCPFFKDVMLPES